MFDDCVILAGGSGTRLWPASCRRLPKQFLPVPAGFAGSGSFFSAALERALAVTSTNSKGRVIIIAGADHMPHALAAAATFPDEEQRRMVLIPEPEAKNTAPAIACGIAYAGSGRNMLVLTSDHIIGPLEAFKADAAVAAAIAGTQNALVVFGIPPRSPETGYGYIEAAEKLTPLVTQAHSSAAAYRAISFREKPDKAAAEALVAAGNFYWNSGMFAFSTSFIMEEFNRNAPEVLSPFAGLLAPGVDTFTGAGPKVVSSWKGLAEAYGAARRISFDYAIAEKCRQTVMVAAGFDWYDVGSWDEYARLNGSALSGEVYQTGTSNCFIDSELPVALCGVKDLIVVIRSGKNGKPPTALISRKGETQRVKEIVEQIALAGRTDLL
ncbi:MAG: NTP transferase domain-containing protein [Treponema sp.]|jgi:mannose-1-phosphate guanylyltransferase/mannose-1-phosphate guanylyltransferase/mannose-6-phosphate isomerase|nr:NTP transferase domain-containing protein [Treponema sp.]